MKFRKKPVEVEAVRFVKPYRAVREFCPIFFVKDEKGAVAWGLIDTLEGEMQANIGDWIIRGVQGEFYPCKPDIFEATYEAVS